MKRLLCTAILLATAVTPAAARNTLSVQTTSTASGDSGVFAIVMHNDVAVNGANFALRYDPACITPTQITASGQAALLRGSEAALFGGDRIAFLVYDRAGALLGANAGTIFEVHYTVARSLHEPTSTPLTFTAGTAADAALSAIAFDYVDGSLSVTPTAITDGAGGALPLTLVLYPNYPNPFNPSTVMRYSVPQRSLVTLTVYNVLGQKVATLLNEVVDPGTRTIVWDAATLPAGVYFCRLKAGNQWQTRKLVLLK